MKPSLEQIVHELERRYLAAVEKNAGRLSFPKQDPFIADKSRFLLAQCSRRAGKSSGLAERYKKAMNAYPGSTSLYLALTRESAHEIMWPVLEELNERDHLGWQFTESKLLVTAPNNSKLRLMGADQKNFIRRLKGKKHPAIAVDEAQDFGSHLETLVDDVLEPCMTDYRDSWLAITGTPGPVPAGYWYEITHEGKFEYSAHRWTLLDNPYLPSPLSFINELIRRKNWPENHPTLLREWRNEWVLDLASLWIRYNKEVCDFDKLPQGKWIYILGVDLGHDDSDALAVLAYREDSNEVWLVEEVVTAKQGITALVAQIQALRRRYNFTRMPCDEGALGKKIAEEIRREHKIPLHAADKKRKQETVEFLNDAMSLGRFKARSNSRFVLDSYNIQVDRLKTTESKIVLKGPHSDIIDAVIYAFKESPAYQFEKPPPEPQYGSKEWAKKQEDDMFEQALERAKLKKGDPDPFSDPEGWE